MKTLVLEVSVVDAVDYITIEVLGTRPPPDSGTLATRRIDRTILRDSRRSAVDVVVNATGAACEDVVRQIIEQGGF